MDNSPLLVTFGAIGAVASALVYWMVWCWRDGTGLLRSAVKTAAIAGLALTALAAGAPLAVTVGLALGAAGDLALSRPGQQAFLVGMAAFALGHLAYALWFLGSATPPDALRLLAMAGLVALALSTRHWLLPHAGALSPAVAAYVGVIGLMGLAALASANIVALSGALLFVLSDLLLAIALFRPPVPPGLRRMLSVALWPAYWGGQALILVGALGVGALGAVPAVWPFHPAP